MLTDTERANAEVALLACNAKIDLLQQQVRSTPKSDPGYRALLYELYDRRSEQTLLKHLLAKHCPKCNEVMLTPGECPYCF